MSPLVALGAFGVGLAIGLTVGETARRHLRRVNAMLAADAVTARRQRDEWATVAQRPPDAPGLAPSRPAATNSASHDHLFIRWPQGGGMWANVTEIEEVQP